MWFSQFASRLRGGGRPRAKRFVAALVAAALALTAVVLASPASAKSLTGVIKTVTTTPTNPTTTSIITTKLTYCVPNGTQAGDTFSLTMPTQLVDFPLTFDLTDAAGGVVANAVVDPGPPAVATFTMTDYAQTHNVGNVCGSAMVTSQLASQSLGGQTVTLTYTDNGGQTFNNPITVQPVGPVDQGHAHKIGLFNNADQCTSVATDCITWRMSTPLGPWTSGTFTDTASAGQTFDCPTFFAQIGDTSGPNGQFANAQPYNGATVDCTTTSLSISYGAVPDSMLLRFSIDVTAGPDAGGTTFSDTAVSTAVNSATSTTDKETVAAHVTSASGQGNGNGDAVTINKYSTADGPVNGAFDTAPGKEVAANTPIPITMLITNNGTDALTDVTVSDATSSGPVLTGLNCTFPAGGGASTPTTWAGPFAVGASFGSTGTIPALTAGVQETDTATVVGTGVTSGALVTDSNPFNSMTPTPAVTINKYSTADGPVNGAFDTAPGKEVAANTPIPITMLITNNGTEPLDDVIVSDATSSGPVLTGLTCAFPAGGGATTPTTWAGPFAVGATFTCTGTIPALTAGVQETDTATVKGTGAISGLPVTDTNPFNSMTPTPGVTINKYSTADGPVNGAFDTAPGKSVAANTPIPITMLITNNGTEALDNVTVTDATSSGPVLTGLDCTFPAGGGAFTQTTWAGPFAVGASFTCTGTIPALSAGTQETDTATVKGTGDISGLPVTDNNPFNANTPSPKVTISKYSTADGPVAGAFDTAPGKAVDANTPVPITMLITNDGTEALDNVTVTDATSSGPALTGLTCTFPTGGGTFTATTWQGPFAVGASFTCTGTIPAMSVGTQETDTATVNGTGDISRLPVTDNNPFNSHTPPAVPAVTINKYSTADGPVNGAFDTAPGKAVNANTPIPITMLITNTGNEPLDNVTVTDATTSGPALTGLTCAFPTGGGTFTATTWQGPFAVGATFTCTGTVPAMLVGSQETDTATVIGTGAISHTGVTDHNPFNSHTPPAAPAITIVKGDSNGNAADTDATKVNLPNGTANLVYKVTNTGNEPLADVTVSDQVVSNGTVTGLVCTFPDGTKGLTYAGILAVGASFTCTATLSGVQVGTDHEDIGTVTGVGEQSKKPVTSTNPYYAATIPVPAPPTQVDTGAAEAHQRSPLLQDLGAGLLVVAVAAAIALLAGTRRRNDNPTV